MLVAQNYIIYYIYIYNNIYKIIDKTKYTCMFTIQKKICFTSVWFVSSCYSTPFLNEYPFVLFNIIFILYKIFHLMVIIIVNLSCSICACRNEHFDHVALYHFAHVEFYHVWSVDVALYHFAPCRILSCVICGCSIVSFCSM